MTSAIVHHLPRRHLLGLAAVAGGVALAGCSKDDQKAKTSDRPGGYAAGTALEGGWPLPNPELTDQSGRTAPMRDRAGTVTLVFFGYTNCPDVCTGILADLASALQRVPAEISAQVKVLFVSTDPARDTPTVMGEYLARIDEKFIAQTGDLKVITAAATSLGLSIEDAKKLPSGGYEVTHSTQVLGFGKDLTCQVLWSTGTSVANYMTDISLLVDKQK